MASKLAVYETGYEDERFQQIVSQSFHCIICTNVFKDPVMCHYNEHIFCRCCITRRLMNSQTCPTCMGPLTIDTLSQAPRGIRNMLAELKIRCEFFDRGCGKFIELGDLETHVRECDFAPYLCSNEGCELEVNRQDLLYHETTICALRRVKCHMHCNDIRQEMDVVKVNLASVKLARKEKMHSYLRDQQKVKTVIKNVVVKVELIQGQLDKQKEINRRLVADNVEMKKSLNEIVKQLERMTRQTSHEVQAEQEQMKKSIAEAGEMDREPKLVIAGGENRSGELNSVEMFSLSNGTWTRLQPMKVVRAGAYSVIHKNQLFVVGGCTESMGKLSINAVQTDQSTNCENVPAELPVFLSGHGSVVYNGRLVVVGGYEEGTCSYSDRITEVSLVPPYTSKLLATIPQTRCYHGVALFRDKFVILGGRENFGCYSALRTALIFDITKNECKELAPLPYPVSEMATVKWGDDSVIMMGGADSDGKPLNKVFMYNVKTQKSHTLPDMKYRRAGCVAAVVRDTVIVMGGKDERGNYLKSVEGFRFDRYTWEELPEMHEERCHPMHGSCMLDL